VDQGQRFRERTGNALGQRLSCEGVLRRFQSFYLPAMIIASATLWE